MAPGTRVVAALVLSMVFGGCAGAEQPTSSGPHSPAAGSPPATTPPRSPAAPASPPGTGAASVAPSAGRGEFLNPVIDANFPDPHVILADDVYYAYSTTDGTTTNVRVARSEDLVNWGSPSEALPELAAWSGLTPLFTEQPHRATWAPAVTATSATYVMYYTTPALDVPRPDGKPSQCIGIAVSEDPGGPFADSSSGPIVCQPELGGSIDATAFTDDDGTRYLVWKNDGNCCGIETQFFIQELTQDGLSLVGEATDMGVRNDARWERHVIEAPTLYKHDGTYYLFYSGNDFNSVRYAVGYATAERVRGPYTDAEENPILVSEPPAAGPGHQSIVTDRDGDLWLTYHAWDIGRVGFELGGRRAMWIDELRFEGGRAVVDGPDVGPQPVP